MSHGRTVIARKTKLHKVLLARLMQIGIPRSLGESRVDVFTILVLKSSMIIFLASIGGPLPIFLAIAFVNRTAGLLAKDQCRMEIDFCTLLALPGTVALLIILTFSIVCMVAALYPSWRTEAVTPVNAIWLFGQ